MSVVAERGVGPCQQPAFFNKYMVLVVDHDVGDLLILEQRLQRTKAEDFIQQISLDLLLLIETQRYATIADDLADDARHRLPGLTGVNPRKLFQVQLR